jgi:hypothetical protein
MADLQDVKASSSAERNQEVPTPLFYHMPTLTSRSGITAGSMIPPVTSPLQSGTSGPDKTKWR